MWEAGNTGGGVVIATIDTGVRHTHEALAPGFRGGDYSWFDAINGSAQPYDDNGHGTLTTGLVSGGKGVGMAPGAQWIACKGLNASGQGTDAQLLKCGQWVACPTTTDGASSNCSAAPNVVSNSWGDGDEDHPGQGHTTFEPVLKAWQKLGIVGVFAAGNSGDNCTTVVSPADLTGAIAVGGTDRYDYLAGWSSKGPALTPGGDFGTQKPEVVAPGASVASASNTNDHSYGAASGTSLSCPHVAGTVALLLAADGTHTPETIRKALTTSADTATLQDDTSNLNCGAGKKFPNFIFGYGRVNACRAAGVGGNCTAAPTSLQCGCDHGCASMCGQLGDTCCMMTGGVNGACNCGPPRADSTCGKCTKTDNCCGKAELEVRFPVQV